MQASVGLRAWKEALEAAAARALAAPLTPCRTAGQRRPTQHLRRARTRACSQVHKRGQAARSVTLQLSQTLTAPYAKSIHHLEPLPSPVLQVLHVPQLDRTWGYAPPAASSPSSSPPAPGHWPLLLLACALSSVGAVELLLRSGAAPDAANGYGLTALTALVHNDGMTPGEKLAAAKVRGGGGRVGAGAAAAEWSAVESERA